MCKKLESYQRPIYGLCTVIFSLALVFWYIYHVIYTPSSYYFPIIIVFVIMLFNPIRNLYCMKRKTYPVLYYLCSIPIGIFLLFIASKILWISFSLGGNEADMELSYYVVSIVVGLLFFHLPTLFLKSKVDNVYPKSVFPLFLVAISSSMMSTIFTDGIEVTHGLITICLVILCYAREKELLPDMIRICYLAFMLFCFYKANVVAGILLFAIYKRDSYLMHQQGMIG